MLGQVLAVWSYRELLVGLVRRELKVKYRDSTLGFLWSLLNPALSLAVFYVVFQIILGAGIPDFAIFLLCGLLVWNLFSGSLAAATGSISGAGGLVNKVWFPRLILPLAAVGAAMVHFFLQGVVLVTALAITRYDIALTWLPLLALAFVATVVLSAALAIVLSAVNVYARDTQHFLELGLLAWFWMTPIVYPVSLQANQLAVRPNLPDWLHLLNPVTPLVLAFQRVLHNQTIETERQLRAEGGVDVIISGILPDNPFLWYAGTCAVVLVVSLVACVGAVALFSRLEGNFAEEL